jgi:hypothetical protein
MYFKTLIAVALATTVLIFPVTAQVQPPTRGVAVPHKMAEPSAPKFDANEVATLLEKAAAEDEQKRSKDEMNGWAILLLALILYFCPTGIAFRRGHHNRNAIFVLNLFLGWTLLGWVAALVWANTQT